jgi:[ribosomal protein S5]-alanine N-acetyltransferase
MAVHAGVIHLRPIQFSDWTSVHEWASTTEACRYQPWGPNTVDDTQSFVAEATAAWDERPQRRYVWSALSDGGNVVGLGELKIHSRRWRHGEIAYAVHTRHWGSGVGTAIGAQLVRFGFDQLGLHRIAATCDPRNLASAAVLRKLGMTYEGRLRETIELRDGWRDSAVFSILASEHQGFSTTDTSVVTSQ